MAEECPVNIECSLFQSVDCGSHVLYIGDVIEIYTNKSCITDGKPDVERSGRSCILGRFTGNAETRSASIFNWDEI